MLTSECAKGSPVYGRVRRVLRRRRLAIRRCRLPVSPVATHLFSTTTAKMDGEWAAGEHGRLAGESACSTASNIQIAQNSDESMQTAMKWRGWGGPWEDTEVAVALGWQGSVAQFADGESLGRHGDLAAQLHQILSAKTAIVRMRWQPEVERCPEQSCRRKAAWLACAPAAA